MQFAAVCVWIQTTIAPATVSSCVDDVDTTACLNGLKANVSPSALDHRKCSVSYGSNEEAGISRVIEICPQVCAVCSMFIVCCTPGGFLSSAGWANSITGQKLSCLCVCVCGVSIALPPSECE